MTQEDTVPVKVWFKQILNSWELWAGGFLIAKIYQPIFGRMWRVELTNGQFYGVFSDLTEAKLAAVNYSIIYLQKEPEQPEMSNVS